MKLTFDCPRPMPREVVDAFLAELDKHIDAELAAVPARLRAIGEDEVVIAQILRLAEQQFAGQRAMVERESTLETSH